MCQGLVQQTVVREGEMDEGLFFAGTPQAGLHRRHGRGGALELEVPLTASAWDGSGLDRLHDSVAGPGEAGTQRAAESIDQDGASRPIRLRKDLMVARSPALANPS